MIQGALVSSIGVMFHFLIRNLLQRPIPFVGAAAAGVTCTAMVLIKSKLMRHSFDEVHAYQSHDYWQKKRITNSLQVITHVFEECNHIGDPEHQNCRAVARKELKSIQSALGKSPNPDIIRGNKEDKSVTSFVV